MALFKKKQAEASAGTKDWEQTLVTDDVPREGSTALKFQLNKAASEAAGEPVSAVEELVPLEPVQEPSPPPVSEEPGALEPEAPLEPLNVPADLEPLVKTEGSSIILKQHGMYRTEKRDAENRLREEQNLDLSEKRWIPHRRESLRDVEHAVDSLAWKGRYQPRAVAWLRKQKEERRKALEGIERIPANIVKKRIVYETEGGFVVEVTYRELGEVATKYFTVPTTGGPSKALQSVRSGNYARVTVVSGDAIEALEPSHPGKAKLAVPPGKVHTWPIHGRFSVLEIEGIGRKYANQLNRLGIESTDQLRLYPAEVIARHLGTHLKTVEKWQSMAELLCVPGLGKQYAELLVRAGIGGVETLKTQTPGELIQTLKEHAKGGAVGVGPARARSWIQTSRRLKKKTQPFPAATPVQS